MANQALEKEALLRVALRHKKWLIVSALLIIIVGVFAAAYVGEAIQFKQGSLEFRGIKLTLESGGTLVCFLALSAWVFYLGSGAEIEVQDPKENKPLRILVRRIRAKEVKA